MSRQAIPAKSKKTPKSRIGHDPLAWLKDEETQQTAAPSRTTAASGTRRQARAGSTRVGSGNTVRKVTKRKAGTTSNKTAAKKRASGSRAGAARQVVVLDESVGIADANTLYGQLKSLLGHEGRIVVDAAKVETVDAAALQLLLAFVKARRDRSAEVSWDQPSEALCRAAAVLDIVGPLGL